uniref:ATP-binding protein n=1 Tax=Pararhizobium sp. IMCC3301 TaxID=3067904 RepID=UPI002740908C|nr:ATP-binding protein [Pararhizobium sp. IMCC3301]
MTIRNFTSVQVDEILAQHLTPSDVISDPVRLIGREKYLEQIRRALTSPGRHVFIFGERGVGKTSLAMTAGKANVCSIENFTYVPCGEQTTFFEVVQIIGNSAVALKQRIAASGGGWSAGAGVSIPGIAGANANFKQTDKSAVPLPTSWAEVYDVLRFVRSKRQGQIIIAIDEFDRVKHEEKTAFAELLKNVGTQVEDMRFIFCGIGANVNEILGEHLSTGRMFEPVEIDKLHHDMLWKIIEDASAPLHVQIDQGILLRIGIISDGFPHFVHLIGQCLIYAMLDDQAEVSQCQRVHFEIALKEALQKTEPSLKRIYSLATEKAKNQTEYEEALWALADRTATKRKLDDIEQSYRRIVGARYRLNCKHEQMDRYKLNQRLLTLRKDNHAKIVEGHGSGFYSFREGVVRGYVRLMAENNGVQLAAEITN